MSRWDVQRDMRDNRIVAIRPEGFRGWGTGDKIFPLAVTIEDLGLTYFDKDAVSLEKGGDGLTRTAKQLILENAVKVDATEAAKVLTVEQLDAEIQRRGYKPISLSAIEAGEV